MKEMKLTNLHKECARILLECISKKKYTIEFGEISRRTGIDAHAYRNGVGDYIGDLSKRCYQLGLPMISVMVVNHDTGLCPDGFLYLCNDLNVHPEYEKNMTKMFDICMKEVIDCKEWYRLADDLDIKIDGLNQKEKEDTLLESIQTEKIEGKLIQITATTYERNPELRYECIKIHGTNCKICGFDAAKIYGNEFIGKIHVHHITPLGSVKESHEVNPETDLIPVCPNCHMIIHSKKDGVYTPDEVIAMINENKINHS